MKNRKLKKSVVYFIYALSFVLIVGAIYFLDVNTVSQDFENDVTYVNDVILEETYPVISVKEMIFRPFLDDTVKVVRNFYDSTSSEEDQKNSLIYYQGTYIPNSGIDYKAIDIFDVMSILDGTVTKVSENNLLGKIVEVTHKNNIISVYQSLGEIVVVEGETVTQGQIIGKSGESNISTELGNHLHFEIIYNGKNVNPENCYGKEIDQL